MSKNEFLRKKMQIYNIDAFSKHVDCLLPCLAHPAKVYLNKKWLPKQNTIQNFIIDVQGFRKTRNENPSMQEIEVTI